MRTLFFTIVLLLFCNLSYAERVTAKGDHRYFGDTSDDDACEHALRKAKSKALEKVLGQTISSEELEKCSTVDGKTNCERNQFFLSSFGGVLTKTEEISREIKNVKVGNSKDANMCLIEIKTDVKKTIQKLDPSFDFNVKLNEYNFRDGDNLIIDVELNKPMYLTVFQILPYEKKDYQVHKIFPNELDKDNFIEGKNLKLPRKGKFEIYYPENNDKKSIDEYLFFVGSKEDIKWLDKYDKMENFRERYIDKNMLNYTHRQYTIIR